MLRSLPKLGVFAIGVLWCLYVLDMSVREIISEELLYALSGLVLVLVLLLYMAGSERLCLKELFEAVPMTADRFADHLDPRLAKRVNPDQVQTLFAALLEQWGPYQGMLRTLRFADEMKGRDRVTSFYGKAGFQQKEVLVEVDFVNDRLKRFSLREEDVPEQISANAALCQVLQDLAKKI